MPKFNDALRGYAHPIHKRYGFKYVYCGKDGSRSFEDWLTLSWDHLLPKGHPNRDNHEYIATACMFCNVADNQYFVQAEKRGLQFEGKTRQELIEQRKKYVARTRESYLEFWIEHVKK